MFKNVVNILSYFFLSVFCLLVLYFVYNKKFQNYHGYKITMRVSNYNVFFSNIKTEDFFVKMYTDKKDEVLKKNYTIIINNKRNNFIYNKNIISKQKIILFKNDYFIPHQCIVFLILLLLLILLTLCCIRIFFFLSYYSIRKDRLALGAKFFYVYRKNIISEFINSYNILFSTFSFGFLILFYDFFYHIDIYETLWIPFLTIFIYYIICRAIFFIKFKTLIEKI